MLFPHLPHDIYKCASHESHHMLRHHLGIALSEKTQLLIDDISKYRAGLTLELFTSPVLLPKTAQCGRKMSLCGFFSWHYHFYHHLSLTLFPPSLAPSHQLWKYTKPTHTCRSSLWDFSPSRHIRFKCRNREVSQICTAQISHACYYFVSIFEKITTSIKQCKGISVFSLLRNTMEKSGESFFFPFTAGFLHKHWTSSTKKFHYHSLCKPISRSATCPLLMTAYSTNLVSFRLSWLFIHWLLPLLGFCSIWTREESVENCSFRFLLMTSADISNFQFMQLSTLFLDYWIKDEVSDKKTRKQESWPFSFILHSLLLKQPFFNASYFSP